MKKVYCAYSRPPKAFSAGQDLDRRFGSSRRVKSDCAARFCSPLCVSEKEREMRERGGERERAIEGAREREGREREGERVSG